MSVKPHNQHMDSLIGKKFITLKDGKGFVRLIDYMGDDSAITQAARVSYGNGTKTLSEDAGLIDFLIRHKHTSPLEMCEIKLHFKMPIFIARQVIRHRTANINELSARYSVIKNEFFLPDVTEIRSQSEQNKQARDAQINQTKAEEIIGEMQKSCDNSFSAYNKFLKEENLAREISRSVLPQGTYTEFYWKIDLHNLFHFLRLRLAPGAQFEIREYSEIILEKYIKGWVPMCYASFKNHAIEGKSFSGNQIEIIKSLLDKDKIQNYLKDKQKEKGEKAELSKWLKDIQL